MRTWRVEFRVEDIDSTTFTQQEMESIVLPDLTEYDGLTINNIIVEEVIDV